MLRRLLTARTRRRRVDTASVLDAWAAEPVRAAPAPTAYPDRVAPTTDTQRAAGDSSCS